MTFMEWDGITSEQYDEARKLVNWEGNAPAGGMFHVAAQTEKGMRICDVWESPELFQAFIDNRLMPGVQQLGLPGEPRVEVHPAHAVFAPGYRPA